MRIYVGMKLLGQRAVGGADLRGRAAAVEAERGVVVGNRTLQAASLLRDGVHVSFIDGRGFFAAGQQLRAFEQAAEIFFAGDGFRAGLAGEAGMGFVFHFQPFKADDADELPVFFSRPGLGRVSWWWRWQTKKNPAWRRAQRDEVAEEVCLSCFFRRDNNLRPYFFFAPFLAAAFFGAGLEALDLTAFLAMMFFELLFVCVRNDWFLRSQRHHVPRPPYCK